MMTSPTGRRVTPFAQLKAQEDASWRMMRRMRDIMIASGAKEVTPDMFETSGDYATIEQRIVEAMKEL